MARRTREPLVVYDWGRVFRGHGLDVGSGDDPLSRFLICEEHPFNRWEEVKDLDLPDGAGDDVTQFVGSDEQFDFVHGSQVLEHAIDPAVMLRSWLKVLKPGGHIVATVPDWELYEKKTWPSKWNAGHRSQWTIREEPSTDARFYVLPIWLEYIGTKVSLCRLVTTNYDFSLGPEIDQTLDSLKGVECFIEFVLLKVLCSGHAAESDLTNET